MHCLFQKHEPDEETLGCPKFRTLFDMIIQLVSTTLFLCLLTKQSKPFGVDWYFEIANYMNTLQF